MMSVGLHMRSIAHPARAVGLERLLDYEARRRGITRRVDIARHWIATHPYPGKGLNGEACKLLFFQRRPGDDDRACGALLVRGERNTRMNTRFKSDRTMALTAARGPVANALVTPEDAAATYGAGYPAPSGSAACNFPDVAFTLIVDLRRIRRLCAGLPARRRAPHLHARTQRQDRRHRPTDGRRIGEETGMSWQPTAT